MAHSGNSQSFNDRRLRAEKDAQQMAADALVN